ncbi:hypothetical protein IX324_001577 [Bacteroides pyogenes]|nr:hypothetical protein [Bacteroides pyogenes]
MTSYLYSVTMMSANERIEYVDYIESELRDKTVLQVLSDTAESANNLADIIYSRYPDNLIYHISVRGCQVTFHSVPSGQYPPLLCVVDVLRATVK